MSKVFYDHLISFEEIEIVIRNSSGSSEEKEEIWKVMDEIIHHRILGSIFDRLPSHNHQDFLERFHKSPGNESHLSYLQEKIEDDIEAIIKKEMEGLKLEILKEIKKLK